MQTKVPANQVPFFNPVRKKRLQYGPWSPKNPVIPNGERGFCILGSQEIHIQKIMVFKLGINQRRQERPGDHT